MTNRARWLLAAAAIFALIIGAACGGDDDESSGADNTPASQATSATQPTAAATKASGDLVLATTTSTQDSGLLDVLVPMFEEESGYNVQVIAVGSGQAIEQASRGDADVVLVHSPAAEKKMVDDGDGIERTLVMHNDFIIVGPEADPAGVAGAASVTEAMTKIATAQSPFISRGDDSGTNALELKLWKAAAIEPAGSWYTESGQGMGATLQIAGQRGAYTISDRATFLAQSANLDLQVLFEDKPELLNVYHTIVVNPEKHPDVRAAGARAFAAFMVRPDVQEIIGKFGVDKYGEPLFFADAGKPEPAG